MNGKNPIIYGLEKMNGAAKKTASEWTQFVPQENPDSLEKSRELNVPSLAINLMDMNF